MIAHQDEGPVPPLFSRKCSACGLVKMCAAFRAIAPLIYNWSREEIQSTSEPPFMPFDPEDLATICREFISLQAMQVLKSGELRDAR